MSFRSLPSLTWFGLEKLYCRIVAYGDLHLTARSALLNDSKGCKENNDTVQTDIVRQYQCAQKELQLALPAVNEFRRQLCHLMNEGDRLGIHFARIDELYCTIKSECREWVTPWVDACDFYAKTLLKTALEGALRRVGSSFRLIAILPDEYAIVPALSPSQWRQFDRISAPLLGGNIIRADLEPHNTPTPSLLAALESNAVSSTPTITTTTTTGSIVVTPT